MTLRWLPNALCVVRLLLVLPIVMLLLERRYVAALVLFFAAGATDALDGFLAKSYGWRTRLGSLLDPAADKLLIVGVFATLTALDLVPLGLTAIVVGRDVLIVAGVLAYQWLIGPVEGMPTAVSKLNTAFELSFVLCVLAEAAFGWPPSLVPMLLGAAVVFTSITSGLAYALTWSRRAWRAHAAA